MSELVDDELDRADAEDAEDQLADAIKYGTVDVPEEEFQDENITVQVPFLKYKILKAKVAELEKENKNLKETIDLLLQESMADDL